MASDDIAQLAEVLSKTHVGDGELSFKGQGLKLDNAASGQMPDSSTEGDAFTGSGVDVPFCRFQWRRWSVR